MEYRKSLKFPAKTGIKTRAGHLNNAFYQTAFPQFIPTISQEDELYDKLGIENGVCAYCGRQSNKLDADHLHPLINHEDEKVLYLTDITNIVPCCPECNNKKGNRSFEEFYTDTQTQQYLSECGLTREQYEDKLKRISEYASHSKQLHLDDEDVLSKDYILRIKDKFCDLLNKYSMYWGNEVLKENGETPVKIDDKNLLTKEELELIDKLGDLLGVDKNQNNKVHKSHQLETGNPLW